jgi:hypothetical protein
MLVIGAIRNVSCYRIPDLIGATDEAVILSITLSETGLSLRFVRVLVAIGIEPAGRPG